MNSQHRLLTGELPYMLDGLFYYYGEGSSIIAVSNVDEIPNGPDGDCVSFWTIDKAIIWLNMKGCSKISQHKLKIEDLLALEVVKIAVDKYGEIFPLLYRGVRSDRLEKEHMVLFASENLAVAEFYGSRVKKYENIKGLRTVSFAKSVLAEGYDDYTEQDEEVIFFYEHNVGGI